MKSARGAAQIFSLVALIGYEDANLKQHCAYAVIAHSWEGARKRCVDELTIELQCEVIQTWDVANVEATDEVSFDALTNQAWKRAEEMNRAMKRAA